jgi:hypothetical protein
MTGTAGASNPQVRNQIRPSPQVVRSAPENTLKVETQVRTPLGLRRSEAMSGCHEGKWPPHWPRGVHDSVTTSCSVTRPKNHVDST